MARMDIDTQLADSVPLDVEAYSANYTSHTKIDRLLFISKKCAGAETEVEALQLALTSLRESQDTSQYKHVATLLANKRHEMDPDTACDSAWVETTNSEAVVNQEVLEQRLHGFKANFNKESIRIGYNDLATFFYERGLLQDAFKNFLKTRDYCTTAKHVAQMCLNVMKVALEMGGYNHVGTYLRKAEQLPEEAKDKITVAKLNCLGGLKDLESQNYNQAARKFVEVDAELGSQFNEVIAPQDVATYGGLCALASFTRQELKEKVVDNIGFREFLELVPEVRECIYDFYKSRYASCLCNLARMKSSLTFDIYLHAHIDDLHMQIRQKALIQYTEPFSSVLLQPMADAFSVSVSELEKELVVLIMDNQIQARIDSHKKILFALRTNVRKATFQHTLRFTKHYIRETKALLLRANLMKHEMVQKQSYTTGKRAYGTVAQQPGGSTSQA